MNLMNVHNPFHGDCFFKDRTMSTMIDAQKNPQHGAIYMANMQLEGKCRNPNRKWINHEGDIALTLCLDKSQTTIVAPMPLLIALSLAEYLDAFNLDAEISIKWPNDVLVNSKKIAGILCKEENNFYFIGVGFNLKSKATLLDLDQYSFPAIGLEDLLQEKSLFEKETHISLILESIYLNLKNINWLDKFNTWLYRPENSISYQVGNTLYTGIIHHVEDDGGLTLQLSDNSLKYVTIYAGEVVRR